jgi:hypothetical protein
VRDRGCLLLRRLAAAAAATAVLAATARGLQEPVTTRAAVAADRSVRCAALLPAVCIEVFVWCSVHKSGAS